MSLTALAAVFRRDLAPVDPTGRRLAASLMASHAEPARDGERVSELGWITLGVRSFWTTPEEVGERQPLAGDQGRCALVFDGRLDNRSELLRELGAPASEPLSDAGIVLRFLAAGRWHALPRFLGPWALIFADLEKREVTLARDPIGGRMLCWHASARHFVAASEPAAVLRASGASTRLDDSTMAAYFADWRPRPDATFYQAVKQVPPGHRLVVTAAGERLERTWAPPRELLRLSRDEEYVERFRSILADAVAARLRGPAPPAVLMSGGLDSTTVAALAGRRQHAAGGEPVRAVSWVFDRLPEADEREFIQPMAGVPGLELHTFAGDDCWPLKDCADWSIDADAPFENPYRPLHGRAYETAASLGARTLLSGHFSDEMYCGVEGYWLRDLLARRRLRTAAGCLRDHFRYRRHPEGWTPRATAVLPRLLFGRRWSRMRAPRAPGWLRRDARSALPPQAPASATPHPEQLSFMLSPMAALGLAVEARRARRHGLELRFPFRDRRLVELALSIPGDQLARPGWYKRLIWIAAEGLIPDAVRLRRRMSDLGPLFVRGLAGVERDTVRRLLEREGRIWPRWVEPELVAGAARSLAQEHGGLPWRILWRCISVELWRLTTESIDV